MCIYSTKCGNKVSLGTYYTFECILGELLSMWLRSWYSMRHSQVVYQASRPSVVYTSGKMISLK